MRTAVPSGHTTQVSTRGRAGQDADVAQRRHAPASASRIGEAAPGDPRGHGADADQREQHAALAAAAAAVVAARAPRT